MITLVLLPGMDGTGKLFSRFIKALGAEHKLKVISYPPVGNLGYEELEEIARKFLPENEQFIILGESFSGPIATSLAASNPNGLLGLVLSSTFVRNPKPVYSSLKFLVGFIPVKFIPLAVMSYLLFGRHSTPSLQAELSSALRTVSSSTMKARIKAVLSVDVSDKLREIRVPVIYLYGTEDRVVPMASLDHIRNVLPDIHVVSFEGPHCLLQTVPDEVAAALNEFINIERLD